MSFNANEILARLRSKTAPQENDFHRETINDSNYHNNNNNNNLIINDAREDSLQIKKQSKIKAPPPPILTEKQVFFTELIISIF